MIDLHCHLLPGLDDGARDLDESIAMARMAQQDGIRAIVCTPHVKPGIYDNRTPGIQEAIRNLRAELARREIAVELFSGADIHIAPNLGQRLRAGEIPSIAGTRYFLFEPPHHLLTPRIGDLVRDLIRQGYVPIITHPERLSWLSSRYDTFEQLQDAGCLVQVTAGSILGEFGKTARYFAERMMEEGRIDLVASDGHDTRGRPPLLSRARDHVARRLGEEEAKAMVLWRPAAILANQPVAPRRESRRFVMPVPQAGAGEGFLQRLFGR